MGLNGFGIVKEIPGLWDTTIPSKNYSMPTALNPQLISTSLLTMSLLPISMELKLEQGITGQSSTIST